MCAVDELVNFLADMLWQLVDAVRLEPTFCASKCHPCLRFAVCRRNIAFMRAVGHAEWTTWAERTKLVETEKAEGSPE